MQDKFDKLYDFYCYVSMCSTVLPLHQVVGRCIRSNLNERTRRPCLDWRQQTSKELQVYEWLCRSGDESSNVEWNCEIFFNTYISEIIEYSWFGVTCCVLTMWKFGRFQTSWNLLFVSCLNDPIYLTVLLNTCLQDDVVMGTLTVHENIMFSANLRLGSSVTKQQRKNRVNEVIEELGLTSCANSKVRSDSKIYYCVLIGTHLWPKRSGHLLCNVLIFQRKQINRRSAAKEQIVNIVAGVAHREGR